MGSQTYNGLEKFEILTYPDKFLTRTAKPVTEIDGRLQSLISKMADTMYQAPGVGLAAIQVNIDQSLLVYDVTPQDEERNLQVLINPRILETEGKIISENEGCLSVPDYRADVPRNERIFLEGLDREGKPIRIEADGFLAIVLQHEIDHLNGRLFIDRLSSLKRQIYTRRVKKMLKQQANN